MNAISMRKEEAKWKTERDLDYLIESDENDPLEGP